jgi:hypothetical protein
MAAKTQLVWSNGSLQLERCRKKQQGTFLVTSVPHFDGYQWRKYGQKQIQGAMYPRYTLQQYAIGFSILASISNSPDNIS